MNDINTLIQRIRGLSSETVTRPTLVYFDIIGIGWPIRCLLHLKAVDHELIQISIAEWAHRDDEGNQVVKAAFVNGHVPLYVDPDVRISQSLPLLQYLAEKHDMMGNSVQEKFRVLEIMNHAYDALFHFNGMLPVNITIGIDEENARRRLESFMGRGQYGLATNGYDAHLKGFSSYLAQNESGSGYFVGSELTIADLHAFNLLCNWYKAFDRERFAAYPELEAFIQRIAEIPGVADYIANQQEPTSWFRLPQIAMRLTSEEELEGLIG
ncbi:MAG: glutathione S-transferase family protein [Pseudomonadales bacterium]|nr:glutathione S-transferase family protein [Pseudomonadales bacterium]